MEAEIEAQEAVVFGDKRLLGQVISNLLTNAIKYNRDQGRVLVKLQVQPDLVRVDVQDTGFGIPEEDQPHIFERFYRASNPATRQTSGSGLGLTIVKSIIERHSGYLWFESVENEGSRFSFTLPRTRQLSEGADRVVNEGAENGEGRDLRQPLPPEMSIEDHDDVDDNTQEATPLSDTDSSSDEL